uniref:Excision repair crosscomplementing rodent repair deficiency, complementation group 5 [Columba livia] n=1 Tax=Lepeophtheirus salmonis TaxID=72036 RepID=A0A0K2UF46_LEPSM
MGVQGLWSILEPTGKVISVETLENQILAIDISLWLHQSVKGFRNPGADGVAHILGLFHRLCKLLFYGIRPVFVFDGRNIPQLKKETLLKRRLRNKKSKEKVAESLRTKAILGHLMTQVSQIKSQNSVNATITMQKALKHGQKGLSSLLSRRTGSNQNPNEKDLFELPPVPSRSGISENEDSDIDEEILNCKFKKSSSSIIVDDIHDVDIKSSYFQSLPKDEQYNILFEMKEKRKMNSWAKMDAMPKKADNFSDFQVQRLLKRANIQKTMVNVEKELGDRELDLIDPHLFVGDKKGLKAKRLASDNKTTIIYGSRRRQEQEDLKKIEKGIVKVDPDCPGTSISENNSASTDESLQMYSDVQTQEALLQMIADNRDQSSEIKDEDIYTQEVLLQSFKSNSTVIKDEIDDMYMQKEALHQMITDSKREEIIEDDFFILAPSVMQYCNQRQGGKTVEKSNDDDPIPGTSTSLFSAQEEPNGNTEVGVMSSSSDESDNNGQIQTKATAMSEDIFGDVFNDKNNIEELDKILLQKSVKPTMLRKRPIQRSHSCSASSSGNESSCPPSPLPSTSLNATLVTSSFFNQTDPDSSKSDDQPPNYDVIKEISTSMKNSDHLYLKIASKYVPFKETTSQESSKNESCVSNEDKSVHNTMAESLRKEGDCLIKEMNSSEKESRLLQYQNVNYTTNAIQSEKNDTVFGSAAPGYIRSGKSINVQEVDVEPSAEALIQEKSNLFADDENRLDVRDLISLQNKLAKERETIIAEASKQERLAASITDQMYQECQELLQIFGIPYVVAPGEAEAQCAYLENIKLTNGTVTDDSDVWVFGSRKVYKNFFEREKFVEYFSSSEIEQKLGLTQGKMISIAMLTGSDYTEGIYNVGPITALEILAEFQGEELEPLSEFKNWLEDYKQNDFSKPVSRVRENFKKLDLIDGFPSPIILDAYKSPLVDKSDEKFTWAIPNFVAIRDYATEKFGFTYGKVDEMLSPIVKRISAKSLQTRIDNYFVSDTLNVNQKEMISKRGLSAIERVKGKKASPIKSQSSKTKKSGGNNIIEKNKNQVVIKKNLSKEEKNELAKKRALEVLKRDSKSKKKLKRPKRVTLTQHNLSEDSDSE